MHVAYRLNCDFRTDPIAAATKSMHTDSPSHQNIDSYPKSLSPGNIPILGGMDNQKNITNDRHNQNEVTGSEGTSTNPNSLGSTLSRRKSNTGIMTLASSYHFQIENLPQSLRQPSLFHLNFDATPPTATGYPRGNEANFSDAPTAGMNYTSESILKYTGAFEVVPFNFVHPLPFPSDVSRVTDPEDRKPEGGMFDKIPNFIFPLKPTLENVVDEVLNTGNSPIMPSYVKNGKHFSKVESESSFKLFLENINPPVLSDPSPELPVSFFII